jgi:NhaP-type Na+/H+ or K+/H+ antiporter
MLGYSGAIAALAFGIALGNADSFNRLFSRLPLSIHPVSLISIEKVFFSEMSFLLKTFFFVFIGISIVLTNQTWMIAGLILTLVIFYVRVPIVWSSVQRTVPVADVSMMAVMVPKGLAAAVLASMPLQQGVAGGEMIQCITYAVVLFSITINSALVFLLEKTPVSRFYGWMFRSFGRHPIPKKGDIDATALAAQVTAKF